MEQFGYLRDTGALNAYDFLSLCGWRRTHHHPLFPPTRLRWHSATAAIVPLSASSSFLPISMQGPSFQTAAHLAAGSFNALHLQRSSMSWARWVFSSGARRLSEFTSLERTILLHRWSAVSAPPRQVVHHSRLHRPFSAAGRCGLAASLLPWTTPDFLRATFCRGWTLPPVAADEAATR